MGCKYIEGTLAIPVQSKTSETVQETEPKGGNTIDSGDDTIATIEACLCPQTALCTKSVLCFGFCFSISRMSLLQISPAVHRLVWQRLRPQILSSSALMVKRSYIGDYDKKKKLLPKDVTYKYGDDRFLKGPTYNDEPFLKPTEDEIIELTRVKLEDEIMAEQITKVDPQQEPFTEVLEGFPDTGKFTKVETVK